jgi:hypothetical protein
MVVVVVVVAAVVVVTEPEAKYVILKCHSSTHCKSLHMCKMKQVKCNNYATSTLPPSFFLPHTTNSPQF